MKCYELTKCSEKERQACAVWNSLREHPEDFEDLKCWVIKGMYQDEKGQGAKCRSCKYYIMMNRETGLVSDFKTDVAVVTVTGSINQERTRALEQVWETLKKNNKTKVVLDLTGVNAIYSPGLGLLVTMQKEAAAAGGAIVVAAAREQLHPLFASTKLTKFLHFAPDKTAAAQYFESIKQREEAAKAAAAEEAKRAEEEARKAAEAAKPKAPPKKFVRCFEYWNNHNPKNATTCDECFNKLNPTSKPCWVVEGFVEGVAFQFINEECMDCKYFEEYGVQHKPG